MEGKGKGGLVKESRGCLAPRVPESRNSLAIVLRYYGDRSTREIADALACSEGTARNVLFRGLAKLRTMMTASQESLR